MARATPPTLRQRRLAVELRKLRERAGLSTNAAAARIGIQPTQISMIESGRHAVSADRVRAMADVYACDDTAFIDALAEMTGGRVRGWWDEYREMLPATLTDVAEWEHWATSFRLGVVLSAPGLLQTPEYARAIIRQNIPRLRPHDIEHRVSFRIKRQSVLFRESPPLYRAVVHEAALRMRYGGPEVARGQLLHMAEMAQQGNITLTVVPFERVDFPTAGQPITYTAGPVSRLDTVALDSDHGCDFFDAEAQLSRYRAVLDRYEDCALSPAKSREFIHKIAKDV